MRSTTRGAAAAIATAVLLSGCGGAALVESRTSARRPGTTTEDGRTFTPDELLDRAKDMILRGGENVYSAEVEAAVYEHPSVYEAAVFGVPHERLGEEVAVALVPRPGHDVDPAELASFLSTSWAPLASYSSSWK